MPVLLAILGGGVLLPVAVAEMITALDLTVDAPSTSRKINFVVVVSLHWLGMMPLPLLLVAVTEMITALGVDVPATSRNINVVVVVSLHWLAMLLPLPVVAG
jgi:hypothetical protein